MHSQDPLALQLTWGLDVGSTRGPRPRFTLEEIAQAGVKVADDVGLDGLSLALVAQHLGLTTTGLYRYVPSKEILIELAADAAAGPAPLLTGETWQRRATSWTHARARQIRRHPWLVDVRPGGLPRLPHAVAWIEALLTAVADTPQVDGLRLALLLDTVAATYTRNALTAIEEVSMPDWLQDSLRLKAPRFAEAISRQSDANELEIAVDIILRGVAE